MSVRILSSVYYVFFLVIFFIAFLVSVSTLKRKKKQKKIVFILMALMAFFTGSRWETGTDWEAYYDFFSIMDFSLINSSLYQIRHFDIGYRVLNAIVHAFTDNYSVFLLLLSSMSLFFVYYAVKKETDFMLISLCVFYANYFLAFYMGSNRLILAIGFSLMAMVCVCEKEYQGFIAYQVGSFLFHRSSIICFVNYFIPHELLKKRKTMFLVGTSMIIGLMGLTTRIISFLSDILGRRFGSSMLVHLMTYYNSELHEDLGITHFMIAAIKRIVLIIFFYSIYEKHALEKNERFEFYFNIYILSIVIYFAFYGMGVFQVLSTFFAVSEIFVWSNLYKVVSANLKMQFWIFLFLYCSLEVMGAFPAYIDAYIPYKSIFLGGVYDTKNHTLLLA